MSVYIDGSTMSALLFNHLNNTGHQYGFLLGEKIEHIEDKISDSQIHSYDVNSYIYVSSFVPWPNQECLYNRCGHVSDERMQYLFSNREQHLVGWYSLRHNTTLRPSLRERTLHQVLASSERFSDQPQEFVFFLCTSSSSTNMSTHTCSYSFMHTIDRLFLNLPVTVLNLGDTTRQEYRKRSNASLSHSKTIQGSLQSFQKDFLKPSGEMGHIISVNHLASSINNSLMSVHSKTAESETTLGLLETEVSDLRQQLDLLEKEEMEKIFQIEAENRKNRIEEEMRKQNAVEVAEEQEQLEKLLIDLGMSTADLYCGASMTCNLPLEPFTAVNTLNDQNDGNFQVINPASLLPKESAFINSDDRNTNCAKEISYTSLLAHDMQAFKQKYIGSDDSTHVTRNKETMKDNVSYSIPEEEFRFNHNTCANVQQVTGFGASANIGIAVMHSVGRDKGFVLDVNESSQCKEESSIQNLQSKITHPKRSDALPKDISDSAGETPANNDMRLIEDHETSHSDQDTCVDNYTVSSSPVF